MTTTVLKVIGMSCGHCTSSVEEALGKLAGVALVVADLETGKVTIEHDDRVSPADFATGIEEIGFEVVTP